MNIYFVRHGQTQQNFNKTYYGKIDARLNSTGIMQMKENSKFFKNINIDIVYVSDRKRAIQSSKILTIGKKNIKTIIDTRLNETDFGDFEGKSYEEILKLYPKECEMWQKDWEDFSPPNGESYIRMYGRVKNFMNDIMSKSYNNVLIVTHSGVIKAALCYIMNDNLDLFWKFSCKNGDRIIIKYEYGNMYIDSITHCFLK